MKFGQRPLVEKTKSNIQHVEVGNEKKIGRED
jgi:hypothetical protein